MELDVFIDETFFLLLMVLLILFPVTENISLNIICWRIIGEQDYSLLILFQWIWPSWEIGSKRLLFHHGLSYVLMHNEHSI